MSKSEYAIIMASSKAYSFGLMASMNAQEFYGTNADWEIVYNTVEHSQAEREKISSSFKFNVSWTPIKELTDTIKLERTDGATLEPDGMGWGMSYWLLAHRLLTEKKYKAVCVLQADSFPFVNLDTYLRIAENGVLVTGEFAMTQSKVEDLPWGNDTIIVNRCQCPAFDSINFLGQPHAIVAKDTVDMAIVNNKVDEDAHPVITYNRAIARHCRREEVLGLDRHTWVCDNIWNDTILKESNNRIFNHLGIQICAWHARWWQYGRVNGEWENNRERLTNGKKHPDLLAGYERQEKNYTLVRDFMARFNNMKPEIASQLYVKDSLRRTRWEDGEV